ncbi:MULTISPECIES: hypothetical protein [Nostocaceae]|uniref:hypothetical protein n=1 Tax=Nostocaceae TaxID=1162 RepID=UPI0016873952|nr:MULTISPECIES: hypothetical protein [Nostocaceae]MBD2479514.1 hypothetical protein [Anabaena sp. FACHB-83]
MENYKYNVVPTENNFMWARAWNRQDDILIQPDGWELFEYQDNEPEEWRLFMRNSVRCCTTSDDWQHKKVD